MCTLRSCMGEKHQKGKPSALKFTIKKIEASGRHHERHSDAFHWLAFLRPLIFHHFIPTRSLPIECCHHVCLSMSISVHVWLIYCCRRLLNLNIRASEYILSNFSEIISFKQIQIPNKLYWFFTRNFIKPNKINENNCILSESIFNSFMDVTFNLMSPEWQNFTKWLKEDAKHRPQKPKNHFRIWIVTQTHPLVAICRFS